MTVADYIKACKGIDAAGNEDFYLSAHHPDNTGLPVYVWTNENGGIEEPYLVIQNSKNEETWETWEKFNFSIMSICDDPQLISNDVIPTLSLAELEKIRKFIIINKKALLRAYDSKDRKFDSYKLDLAIFKNKEKIV